MNYKLGKSADDIFANPKKIKEEMELNSNIENSLDIPKYIKEKRQPGRPVEHKERWSKATIVLFDSQILWLDNLSSQIKFKNQAYLSRAEIVRAAVSAMQGSGIDFSELCSEQDITDVLLYRIKG